MGNEMALAKYLAEQEKRELSYEMFLDSIDDELAEIAKISDKIKRKSESYDGYDFSEDIEEAIKDII
jgi:hypothetical protein